jgi:hypothetical protein
MTILNHNNIDNTYITWIAIITVTKKERVLFCLIVNHVLPTGTPKVGKDVIQD